MIRKNVICKLVLLSATLFSTVAIADSGAEAVAGLEEVARFNCQHASASTDPTGLADALQGELGTAMGLRDGSTIIGMIYSDDPKAGAGMWASTLSGAPGGCETLIRMLTQPVDDTLAEIGQ